MATSQTRWNIVVSNQTDHDLRQLLASLGRSKKGELSIFVEEAVRKCIFGATLEEVHHRNAHLSPEYIEQVVDESLAWARNQKVAPNS
jgi:hypothetical protein